MGVPEVEPVLPLGDHDRETARRREVEVVRVGDRDRRALRPAGDRTDGGQAVADVVVDPEGLQVVRGGYMLRKEADAIVGDDLERPLIDHVDGVARAIWDVDAWRRVSDDRAERIGAVVCVDVACETLYAVCGPVSRRYRERLRGGKCRQLRDGRVSAAAGDDDTVAGSGDSGVRDGLRQPAGEANRTLPGVDRRDLGGRRVRGRRAATDQEHAIADCRRGGMGRGRSEAPEAPHLAGSRIEDVDRTARCPIRERSSCDHDLHPRSADPRVAHRNR